MDDEGLIGIEEARIRRLLQHAAEDIGGSQPDRRRVRRRRGRRTAAVVLITVIALAASAGTGFAFGHSAVTSVVQHLASLPSEPPVVETALQELLLHQRNPEIVLRVDSVEVKYVTDEAFWHAISNAWKTGNPSDCGTFSGPSGAVGHWYIVDLHGKFVEVSGPGVATRYVAVAVVMVPAADLQAYWRSLPVPSVPSSASTPGPSNGSISPPAQSGQRTISSSAGFPPVGADGEPLCWSLLPTGS